MQRFSVTLALCLFWGLLPGCDSESGFEKARKVYEENRDADELQSFQGYEIYRRGISYHIFMPPDGARFVFRYAPEDSLPPKLVNEAGLRDAFPDSYDWNAPTFLSALSERAYELIGTFDELGVIKIDGWDGGYIKVHVTPVDVLIYAPGDSELRIQDFNLVAKEIVRLDEHWLYLEQNRPRTRDSGTDSNETSDYSE